MIATILGGIAACLALVEHAEVSEEIEQGSCASMPFNRRSASTRPSFASSSRCNSQRDATDEERAVALEKALALRAVLAWNGIGDARGSLIDPSRLTYCRNVPGTCQASRRTSGTGWPDRSMQWAS
ncbi:hypothetical protein [Roseisalinus antarcticus]|uniref:hypothetical protein n=1 Tax=Roseisalinus antarcticus TaxID=254357 RepID=UPI000A268A50|nr:hypothetical protein [Roseisalinus antarcticus]